MTKPHEVAEHSKRKGYSFPHEKLTAWRKAKDFAIFIYKLTVYLPHSEKYGLISQLRRAAVSVASNLAEGSARTSPRDQAHFTQIAYSSLMETLCQLQIAHELDILDEQLYAEAREKAGELAAMLNSLYSSQQRKA